LKEISLKEEVEVYFEEYTVGTLWFRIKVLCLVRIKTAVHSVRCLSLLFLSAVHI